MTQASTSVLAFYVFGDSTVDAGNNNNIEDGIKANFYPYGVDYNNQSTGRFTNGLTVADFMGNYYFQVSLSFVRLKHQYTTFIAKTKLEPPKTQRNLKIVVTHEISGS
ncbi:hypothetical protein CsSME_00020038 [Camellia sinensis var. sinensis]